MFTIGIHPQIWGPGIANGTPRSGCVQTPLNLAWQLLSVTATAAASSASSAEVAGWSWSGFFAAFGGICLCFGGVVSLKRNTGDLHVHFVLAHCAWGRSEVTVWVNGTKQDYNAVGHVSCHFACNKQRYFQRYSDTLSFCCFFCTGSICTIEILLGRRYMTPGFGRSCDGNVAEAWSLGWFCIPPSEFPP